MGVLRNSLFTRFLASEGLIIPAKNHLLVRSRELRDLIDGGLGKLQQLPVLGGGLSNGTSASLTGVSGGERLA